MNDKGIEVEMASTSTSTSTDTDPTLDDSRELFPLITNSNGLQEPAATDKGGRRIKFKPLFLITALLLLFLGLSTKKYDENDQIHLEPSFKEGHHDTAATFLSSTSTGQEERSANSLSYGVPFVIQ